MKFEELALTPAVQRAISEMGFVEPSPIQEQAIPAMRQGADIIGQARTGTGKTAAFGIPILEKLAPEKKLQAIVLVPTRELAMQVCEEVTKLGKYVDAHTLPVYGGTDMERQIRYLREGTQIVVGTPGRIMDHMRRGTLKLDNIRTVVLDEADRMLDMGFVEDIDWILAHTPKTRQTALFSATMPDEIKRLASRYMRNVVHLNVSADVLTVPECAQYYIGCDRGQKYRILTNLLKKDQPKLAIIFCSTKRMCGILEERLSDDKFRALALHGNLTQNRRDQVMRQFREGRVQLLIATDLAARGLDIEGITHIFNYDIPKDSDNYVHRIGRTARMGKSGVAYTIVTNEDHAFLRPVQRLTGNALKRLEVEGAYQEHVPRPGQAFTGGTPRPAFAGAPRQSFSGGPRRGPPGRGRPPQGRYERRDRPDRRDRRPRQFGGLVLTRRSRGYGFFGR